MYVTTCSFIVLWRLVCDHCCLLASSSFVLYMCCTSTWGQCQIQVYVIERVYDKSYMLEQADYSTLLPK